MAHRTQAEENYLKAIYRLAEQQHQHSISTNHLAAALHTSAAAVTDMVQRLHHKGLVEYKKYQGVYISPSGRSEAVQILRKHRLWEVFLVEKLKFAWEEVTDVAEQLEHIQSPLLIQRLDHFLGHPAYNPHGEAIPDMHGQVRNRGEVALTQLAEKATGIVVAIREKGPAFLSYLSKRGIYLGAKIKLMERIAFDQSVDISIDEQPAVNISLQASDHILLAP